MQGVLLLLAAVSFVSNAAAAMRPVSISGEQATNMIRQDAGKRRLILFYASYCPACRQVFPEFVRAASAWQAEGGTALAFSVDADLIKLAAYIGGMSLPFPAVRLDGRASELVRHMAKVGIRLGENLAIPLFVVIEADGRVAGQWTGGSGLREALDLAPTSAVEAPVAPPAGGGCDGDRAYLTLTADGATDCKVFVGSPASMTYVAVGAAPLTKTKVPVGLCLVVECAGGSHFERALRLKPGETADVSIAAGDWQAAEL